MQLEPTATAIVLEIGDFIEILAGRAEIEMMAKWPSFPVSDKQIVLVSGIDAEPQRVILAAAR